MNHAIRLPLQLTAGAVAALALLAGTAQAGSPSTHAESQGYKNCVAAAGERAELLDVDGNYYIHDYTEARRYYLNGYARNDDGSEAIRIACQTTPSGHRVLELSLETGRYAARGTDSLASN